MAVASAEDVCKVIETQMRLGFPRRALRWAEDALFQKRAEDDREGEAEAWIAVSKARANLKPQEPGEAVKAAQQALRILESLEKKRSRCLDVAELISRFWLSAGEYSRAGQSAKLWLKQAEEMGTDDKVPEAYAQLFMGEVRLALNDLRDAEELSVEAEEIFNKAGNAKGQVLSLNLRVKVLSAMDNADQALDLTVEALELAEKQQDAEQVVSVLMQRAELLRAENKHEELLKILSRVESVLALSGGRRQLASPALAMQAQAKLCITEKRQGKLKIPTMATLNAARVAVSAARRKRPLDRQALASALQGEAAVLMMQRSFNRAMSSARESAKAFEIADDRAGEARSLLIIAECAFNMDSYQSCRDLCAEVQRVLQGIDPAAVRKAEELSSKAEVALGPPPEELELLRQHDQLMLELQELQALGIVPPVQLPALGGKPGAAQPLVPLQAAPAAQAPSAGGGGARRPLSGKALAVTAETEASLLHRVMQEMVMNIVGEDQDDVEVDMPLMQAGLTSNTAVMFREELANQVPGISLPPTLIFDYPSIAAIADYVIERAPVAG